MESIIIAGFYTAVIEVFQVLFYDALWLYLDGKICWGWDFKGAMYVSDLSIKRKIRKENKVFFLRYRNSYRRAERHIFVWTRYMYYYSVSSFRFLSAIPLFLLLKFIFTTIIFIKKHKKLYLNGSQTFAFARGVSNLK